MEYRTKPLVINAFQIGSSRFYPEWLHDAVTKNQVITYPKAGSIGWKEAFDHARVHTPTGTLLAQRGDWIIRKPTGALTVCSPITFAATYEKVEPAV